jgi:hypothetical protein
MSSIYINDGYNAQKTIPEVPGLHPELVIEYREGDLPDQLEWTKGGRSGEAQAKLALSIIGKRLIKLNGEDIPSDKLAKLKPVIVNHMLDAILGYSPADQRADQKN